MTNNKITERNYHVRKFSKVVFGFEEHQENAPYGLGYPSTLRKISDNHVLSHPAEAYDAANLALTGRVKTDDISWYVPPCTLNTSNLK